MGFDRHHVIAVTSYSRADIDRAHGAAIRIFEVEDPHLGFGLGMLTPIQTSPSNGWFTFFVGPDGGKESGDASKLGDARRAAFRAWLKSQNYEHGESRYAWVEVYYGDDMLQAAIVDDGDAEQRAAGVHLPHPYFGDKPEGPT
ncbi:MAG: hypothetical protein IT306_05795 [Chloroflexi bacterium]|nr:hypothetical protein [Chloroflexota bacterium]